MADGLKSERSANPMIAFYILKPSMISGLLVMISSGLCIQISVPISLLS